ncbi:unnamed protein product [Withania somnifera]
MGSDGPQTSSSFVSPSIYHVFLSFRGEDTRKTFTGSLYAALVGAGWRTFKDDNEIERGENIKTELENAVIHSRSSIIIISKNYATSTWCLDELVKILPHKRTKGHAILPIFYHVDPSEVRDQKKSFAEAFMRYERQIEAETETDERKREWMDKVQKWRAALGEVADSAGILVNNQEDRKESELVEEILQLIEDKLNRTISSSAPYLAGISSRVKNIIACGIGKTTVAKYVFTTNFRSFEGSSFLANIHDICQQPDGLIRLQKQLVYDLTGQKSKIQDTDDGIIKIRDAICFMRVLVIFDDGGKALWRVSSGTSSFEFLSSWEKYRCMEKCIRQVGAIPASQITRKLKLGYDSLKDNHDKNLFLDIACFFTRKDKDYVIAVLDESYTCTRVGIQNLTDRFLLKIEDNKLTMHQMLLDMGREIVRQESPKKPGRRTRLWHYKDSLNVLRENMSSETIEGLFFDMNMVKEDQSFMVSASGGKKWLFTEGMSYWYRFSRRPIKFSSKTIDELELLRLLQINYTHLNGAYKDFPKNLRWLYGVPNDFPLEILAVLDMRNSCLERLWDGRRVLPLVKILNLSDSHSLFKTPDFQDSQCWRSFPNVKNCKRLQKLPRGICNLKILKTLIISGCSNLVELPTELCRIQSLEVFLANEIPMSRLPSTRKQNPIWDALIRSWVPKPRKVLELPWVSLPKSLVNLSLSGCSLSEVAFPRDFSNLMLLQDLDLSENPITCLPDCIRTLSWLNKLEFGSCTMLKSLIDLPCVHTLSVGHCTSLERVKYLSVGCRARTVHLNGCKELTDMEGRFKLEPVGGIEKTMKALDLSMWDSVGSFEVKLYSNSTNTESTGPLKVYFEHGMISLFIPGSKVPDWFSHKSVGATLSFTIPALPDSKIQGITVCSAYTIDWKVWIEAIGNFSQLDAGDTLNVTVLTMDGFNIKEIGIHLIHGEQVGVVANANCQEMQQDYPYQGMIPDRRQGLVELYGFGHMGIGLDFILPYIP